MRPHRVELGIVVAVRMERFRLKPAELRDETRHEVAVRVIRQQPKALITRRCWVTALTPRRTLVAEICTPVPPGLPRRGLHQLGDVRYDVVPYL